MRIVHTCLRYPPASGGVETYTRELVERTRDIAQGRDVRVITSLMRTHGPINYLDPSLLLDDPPYIQRVYASATPFVSYPRLDALDYYIGHHRPDILHGYSFWYQPADVAARYTKKHNIPFMFHPIYYENEIRRKPVWQLYKKYYGTATFAAADVVVVISPQEQQLIERAGFPVKRFELIPPGIDVEKFETMRPNPFASRNIQGKNIITVGRVADGKGVDDLITIFPEVLKVHSDVNLVIIGEDFGAKANLEAVVQRVGVASRVHFVGKLSDEELCAAYQHADLLVHPSHYEAFGIAPAEALAAGTPVIARNVASLPYAVGDAGLLFDSPEELIHHITNLLRDEDRRKSLGMTGKKYVKQEFSWEKSIKKLTQLYSELTPE